MRQHPPRERPLPGMSERYSSRAGLRRTVTGTMRCRKSPDGSARNSAPVPKRARNPHGHAGSRFLATIRTTSQAMTAIGQQTHVGRGIPKPGVVRIALEIGLAGEAQKAGPSVDSRPNECQKPAVRKGNVIRRWIEMRAFAYSAGSATASATRQPESRPRPAPARRAPETGPARLV